MSGTITHSWNGTILTVTSDSGTSSADLKGDIGIRGAQGVQGEQYKPKKGIDYLTEEEINELIAQANEYTNTYVAENAVGAEEVNTALTEAKEYTEEYVASNAAPSGYGLKDSIWISDGRSADEIMSNGWFAWGSNGITNTPFALGYMLVIARQSGKYITQIVFNANYNGSGNTQAAIRTYGTTAWGEWEWVNPPLTVGVEYRTTERINGKAVYTKLIDCGTCNNASKITTNIASVARYAAWMGNGIALPYADSGNWYCRISTNNNFIEIWMNGFTSQKVHAQLWYTKD